MILAITSTEDLHVRRVAQELAKMGHSVRVLDFRCCGPCIRTSYRLGECYQATLMLPDGPLELGDVRSVWMRRPRRPDLSELLNNWDRAFAQREWLDLLEGIFGSLDALFVNSLRHERYAVKPLQLDVAQRVGFRIPDTLITNDPSLVQAFVDRHDGKIVHKTLTAPTHVFLETRRWSDTNHSALEDLPIAPSIFQEEIHGASDLRLTVVGDEIFAAKFDTRHGRASVDSRLDIDVPVAAYQLPVEVYERILLLMRELGLSFGTIDLRLNDAGEYVFFEINPQGQFLYIEILTGLPIAAALADLLARGTSQ